VPRNCTVSAIDLDGLALGAVLGLPLAPVQASVDGDAPALREVAGGVLDVRAEDR
jgi:hypothetical protein